MNRYNFSVAEDLFDIFFQQEKVQGMTYALTMDGKVLHQQCRGIAISATNTAVRETTQFRIASMTKSFCARAILQLRDEQKLALGQTVREILPAINLQESVKELTVFQLLSMRSRLLTDDPWADRHLGITDEEFDELSGGISCSDELSALDYSYSNFGYMILGRIIAVLSGVPAMQYISQTIIQPLGMNNTSWNPDECSATGAVWREQQWIPESLMTCRSDTTVFGGLWSTVADLALWLDFLAKPENEELSFGYSMRPGVQLSLYDSQVLQTETAAYGFGLVRSQLMGNDYISHSGGLPGYGSHMRFDRRTGLGIVCLANSTYAPTSRFGASVLDAVLRSSSGKRVEICEQIQQLSQELLTLILTDREGTPSNLFSHNFYPDYPIKQLRVDILRVQKLLGREIGIGDLQQVKPGIYEFRLNGQQESIIARFSCSPEFNPKIQSLILLGLPEV